MAAVSSSPLKINSDLGSHRKEGLRALTGGTDGYRGIGVSFVSNRPFLNPMSNPVGCETLTKSLNISEPHFVICKVGGELLGLSQVACLSDSVHKNPSVEVFDA